MHKNLQQVITELTELSDILFAVYESPEEYAAGTLAEGVCDAERLERLFADAAQPQRADGWISYPVLTADKTALLVAQGDDESLDVPVRMAAHMIRMYYEMREKETDKNAFAAALLAGEIPAGELYKRASRLHLKDTHRVLFLFELAQPFHDTGALGMLANLFANGRQELMFLQDETHLVLIKSYESSDAQERAQEDAVAAVDTMLSELMIPTRVGYSSIKETLAQLGEAKREAALALQISGIFQEQREVAAYSRLGIARLIHELPKDLCEMFLQEVFGDTMPDQNMDEEMQVTIRLFFENNLNISETARRLFLHRNTLVYRLERFEKLVGLDIRRFDDAMTFQIAMMVLAHYRQL